MYTTESLTIKKVNYEVLMRVLFSLQQDPHQSTVGAANLTLTHLNASPSSCLHTVPVEILPLEYPDQSNDDLDVEYMDTQIRETLKLQELHAIQTGQMQCHICQRLFTMKHHIKDHILGVHLKIRKHQKCTIPIVLTVSSLHRSCGK